jgi:hypothetical protein
MAMQNRADVQEMSSSPTGRGTSPADGAVARAAAAVLAAAVVAVPAAIDIPSTGRTVRNDRTRRDFTNLIPPCVMEYNSVLAKRSHDNKGGLFGLLLLVMACGRD